MAGYVDKQVAGYRKTVGDAVAGKGLQQAIRQLQEKSKVRDTLKPLPARGAITAKRQIGRRGGSQTGDFTETSRSFYSSLNELRSSDGLFVLQYYNVAQIVTDRAKFNYRDYTPS